MVTKIQKHFIPIEKHRNKDSELWRGFNRRLEFLDEVKCQRRKRRRRSGGSKKAVKPGAAKLRTSKPPVFAWLPVNTLSDAKGRIEHGSYTSNRSTGAFISSYNDTRQRLTIHNVVYFIILYLPTNISPTNANICYLRKTFQWFMESPRFLVL